MRVLITGGTGFVGAHALRAMAAGHELYATTRGEVPASLRGLASWIEADLSAPVDTSSLPGELDAVVHLAQSRRYADPTAAEEVAAVNATSTARLLDHATEAGASCFVYASTGGVYVRSADPVDEDGPVNPQGHYFSSKREGERIVGASAGPRPVVLRPFFVYGPGQERMLVAGLLRKVLAGEEIAIEGDPGLRSNPVFVADCVAAIQGALISASSGTFNIAGDEVVSLTELVGLIGEAAGREARVAHTPAAGEGDLIADNTRMRRELGAAPRTSLRRGLAEMVSDHRRGAETVGT